MKALAWITTVFCIIYGVIALVIYQSKHADAIEESKGLRAIEVKVEDIQRRKNRGLSLVLF